MPFIDDRCHLRMTSVINHRLTDRPTELPAPLHGPRGLRDMRSTIYEGWLDDGGNCVLRAASYPYRIACPSQLISLKGRIL